MSSAASNGGGFDVDRRRPLGNEVGARGDGVTTVAAAVVVAGVVVAAVVDAVLGDGFGDVDFVTRADGVVVVAPVEAGAESM